MGGLSRRGFAILTASLAAGSMIPGRSALALRPRALREPGEGAAAPPRLFEWPSLRPGAWATMPPKGSGTFGGGNCLLAVGKEGALLVDTKFTALGRTLRREATNIAGASGAEKLTHVLNTHHHADHTGGNCAFGSDVKLMAHAKAASRIAAQIERYTGGIDGTVRQLAELGLPEDVVKPVMEEADRVKAASASMGPEHFAPNALIEQDTTEVDLGGMKVVLRHVGPGHTDNDVFVWLPEQNVMHTGDLLFHRLNPYIDAGAGATTRGWQKSLAAMIELCNDETIVIPGHGALTDRAGLQAQYDYFDQLRKVVAYAKDVDGMSREEAVKIQPGAFKDLGFPQMLPNAIGVVYDELSAEAR